MPEGGDHPAIGIVDPLAVLLEEIEGDQGQSSSVVSLPVVDKIVDPIEHLLDVPEVMCGASR